MSMTTELTGVQKSANLHRLSRLIAYAPTDELRQIAVDVEQYMEQLIEALEHYKSREERVTNLVRDNSKSWNELYRKVEAKDKRNAELVEALEAKDKQIAELTEVRDLFNSKMMGFAYRVEELEARTVKLPEVRITIAESKLRNLTYQQLDAFNAGALRAVAKLSQVLAAAGVAVEGE